MKVELLPPPVPGGTGHIQSLGRWIDNLMGAARDHRKVEEEMAPLLMSEDDMGPDPEPLEPPPLVPGGTGS